MALEWFRRHQKKFLAFLTAFLMVTWGFGSYWQYLITPRRTAGTIFGTKVSEEDFSAFLRRWKAVFFRQDRDSNELRRAAWQQFAMVLEAQRMGLQVTREEVNPLVHQLLSSQGPIRDVSQDEVEQAVAERLLLAKLIGVIRDQASISNTAIWEQYARDNEKVKVRYIAFKPEHFMPGISVTEEQIKTFYDQHKNDTADPANGVVGYKLKEAVQAELLIARYSDLEKLVKVPEKDIKEYYEDHKDTFKVEPKKQEPKKEGEKKTEGSSSSGKDKEGKTEVAKPASDGKTTPAASKTETPKAAQGASTNPADEKSKSQSSAKSESAPQYKPFEEVKEEIRRKLAAREARQLAKTLIAKADDAILTQLDKSDRADFQQVAKELAKEGLTYVKTRFFTQDEENVVPGFPGLSEGFEREAWRPSEKLEGPEGRFIFQIVARRVPEVQPLSAVREQVVKDLKTDLGMKKALQLAQRLQKVASAEGLEKALAEAQKELPKPSSATKLPASGKDSKKTDKSATPSKEKDGPELKIQESDFFTRPQSFGDGEVHHYSTGIGGDRPNVAREAFELQAKAVGIAVEEKGEKAVYLLQVVERKPAEFSEFQKQMDEYRQRYLMEKQSDIFRAWNAELKKQAELAQDQTRTQTEE